MQVKDVAKVMEEIAPLTYAEDFDNVGLLVGDYSNDVTGILVTLDTTEEVVEEAIAKKCNLIISFHPIIFSGLKKLNGNNYVEKAVLKAIKNDINIYATHTALDNSKVGVNFKISEQLRLTNTSILIPKENTIKQLITYVPIENLAALKNALYEAGAGKIGNYDSCGFSTEGKGNFRPIEGSNPFIGEKGKLESVAESRVEVVMPQHLEGEILKALFNNHPYEEVAYSVINLNNKNKYIGIGMIGELEKEMSEQDFFSYLKTQMNTPMIRHSKLLNKKIKKVAVLGGSGAFAIKNAKNAGADIYITADLKYHDFFSAENKLVLADIGHFESEQFTKNLITSYLKEKFTNFVIFNSGINTNPVNYC
ncbi:Nif3-like dinuclear metal center hexameric protein [Chishuiella sp.]|uniref:Nif3-like dinuclear metal center hexameric protein n=1 Tax=Chishuiella sp. TaxID=1969467 RepID=UPI0028A6BDD5|nr:Nif3-like dinuclear metal center hexameric protein [Chishuiella sp.]